MRTLFYVLLLAALDEFPASAATCYVATTGNDTNAGTEARHSEEGDS